MNCIDISHESNYLISGSCDCSIKLWNLDTSSLELNVENAHSKDVLSINFNHEGTKFVSGGKDEIIKIWRVSSLINN